VQVAIREKEVKEVKAPKPGVSFADEPGEGEEGEEHLMLEGYKTTI